jgi:hypothetical protein
VAGGRERRGRWAQDSFTWPLRTKQNLSFVISPLNRTTVASNSEGGQCSALSASTMQPPRSPASSSFTRLRKSNLICRLYALPTQTLHKYGKLCWRLLKCYVQACSCLPSLCKLHQNPGILAHSSEGWQLRPHGVNCRRPAKLRRRLMPPQ